MTCCMLIFTEHFWVCYIAYSIYTQDCFHWIQDQQDVPTSVCYRNMMLVSIAVRYKSGLEALRLLSYERISNVPSYI